ncbi:MAG: hypothetical protein N3H30_00810 [Candidatus Micrarchaeota archaeon]|nr:hypothetical protein [Candidatus Micrarchaeota archaeon]
MATIDDLYAKLERIERRLDRIEGRLASQPIVRPADRQVAYVQRPGPEPAQREAIQVQRRVEPLRPAVPESKEDRQAREIVDHIVKEEKVGLKELKYLLGFTDEK